jgi:hypothetical protein
LNLFKAYDIIKLAEVLFLEYRVLESIYIDHIWFSDFQTNSCGLQTATSLKYLAHLEMRLLLENFGPIAEVSEKSGKELTHSDHY